MFRHLLHHMCRCLHLRNTHLRWSAVCRYLDWWADTSWRGGAPSCSCTTWPEHLAVTPGTLAGLDDDTWQSWPWGDVLFGLGALKKQKLDLVSFNNIHKSRTFCLMSGVWWLAHLLQSELHGMRPALQWIGSVLHVLVEQTWKTECEMYLKTN